VEALEKTILGYFKTIPYIVSVVLFGSQVRQTANKESDVDIAVLCERAHVPDIMTLIEWREDIAALVHKNVDLVCLNTASPIIGMQVHKNGKILMVKHQRAYAEYQMYLFTDYAELKELRAPMEKDILKRKFYDQS